MVLLRLSRTFSGSSRPTPFATPLPTLPNRAGLFFATFWGSSLFVTMGLMVLDLATIEGDENADAVDRIVKIVAVVNLMMVVIVVSEQVEIFFRLAFSDCLK